MSSIEVNFLGGDPAPGAKERVVQAALAAVLLVETMDRLMGTTQLQAAEASSKSFSSLQAEFALAGHELVRMADGSLMVSRWGMVRPLASIEEARAWLQLVTGRAC